VRVLVTHGSATIPVEVERLDDAGRYRVRLGDGAGTWLEVDAPPPASEPGPATLRLDGATYVVDLVEDRGELVVTIGARAYRLRAERPGHAAGRGRRGPARRGGQRLVAPMPGRVVAVHVRPGDRVEAGAPLVVLEAMKMENEFRAQSPGVVTEVPVAAGQTVEAGALLVALD
jgi:biotin carboxyl carrier protein